MINSILLTLIAASTSQKSEIDISEYVHNVRSAIEAQCSDRNCVIPGSERDELKIHLPTIYLPHKDKFDSCDDIIELVRMLNDLPWGYSFVDDEYCKTQFGTSKGKSGKQLVYTWI